ncbi:hypothetical protein FPHOBKDP_00148 [Listeria phage LPJP1]|nr:hypothetical protein FPHOBKDP_00148 [Listeria phage LPJP1]
MLKPGSSARVFDNDLAKGKSFFTGSMNTQELQFDPFVTGYAFILWTKVPTWVEKSFPGFRSQTQKNFKEFSGISDMELQTAEYTHTFNNNAYRFNSGITKNNTEFTLRHQEFSGNPITNMYNLWVSGISDPQTGIATYPKEYNMEYAAKNHTGELLYIVTRPDVNNVERNNIEKAFFYTAVMPTRIALNHFNYTLGTHDGAEVEMPFAGNLHIGPLVDDYAKEMLRKTYSFNAQGMFNPQDGSIAGENIAVFNDNAGVTGSGLGDI